ISSWDNRLAKTRTGVARRGPRITEVDGVATSQAIRSDNRRRMTATSVVPPRLRPLDRLTRHSRALPVNARLVRTSRVGTGSVLDWGTRRWLNGEKGVVESTTPR